MKKSIKRMLLPVLTLLVIAVGCSGGAGQNKVYSIGVIQLVEHPALDASRNGFIQALADNGYNEGEKIAFDFQNAQGDTNNLSTICDRFVNNKVDMVLAITTPATQAIASRTTEIPILATAVTSYEAAGLVDSDEKPGGNLSGTSDMNPVADQIALIAELFPDAKTIGIIYNSSEDNSIVQVEMAKEEINKIGLEHTEVTVTNANDVQQAMQSLVTRCDAIYIPTDNTLASTMPTVYGVAVPAGIPTMCGESNMVENGGLVTLGIDYFQLGYQTGLMAMEVMEGKNPGDMPVEYGSGSGEVKINGRAAREMGFEIPEKYAGMVIEP